MIYENTPRLVTQRLILRRFSRDDTQALFDILKDAKANEFLPWHLILDISKANEFLQQRFLDYYDRASAYRYAICLREDNIPIGYVCLADEDSRDFGYGLREDFWHKGITSEAASQVLGRIQAAGYSYVTATHDINNPRSGAVLRRLGMKYRYTYIEQWQPKNITVTFRMYQLDMQAGNATYMEYWNKYPQHFIEQDICEI